MMELIPHRRQFLLTNDDNFALVGFEKQIIKDNLFLFYNKELSISQLDKEIYILGRTVTPDLSFLNNILPEIENHYVKLTYGTIGRWALLTSSFIFSDSANLMGLYYAFNKDNKSFAVSSSIGLLKVNYLKNKVTKDPRTMEWGRGGNGYISWYCPPYTKYAEIKKLLASQQFNFADQSITFLNRLYIACYTKIPYENKIAILGEVYKRILTALSAEFDHLLLALTCGNDSRQTLAAALAADIKFSAFTFTHPHMSKHDTVIPYKLSKTGKFSYCIIKEKDYNERDKKIFSVHSSNNIQDGDQYFVYRNQYQALGLDNNDVILRTGISPLIKKLYWDKFSAYPNWEDTNGDLITRVFKTVREREWTVKALNEWIDWNRKNKVDTDWRDMFLLEQREGGWMSLNEHSLDILPYNSVQPFNCQFLIDFYLSFDNYRGIKDKKSGAYKIAYDVINYLAPNLNRVKYNPLDYKKFFKNKFKLAIRKIKKRALIYSYR